MSSGSHLPLCIDSVCTGSRVGQMSVDSLYVANGWMMCCIQRTCHNIFSRSVVRSVGTRQNRTDHCLHTHTHQVPSPLVEHKMHINQITHTHTHIHKHTFYSLLSCSRSVFVQCSQLMCAELCLFVLSFCCLSCFARRHSTRSLGVWCFFSPSGRLLRCLYWMFCTALNVFLHPYSCLTLSQAPPHLI